MTRPAHTPGPWTLCERGDYSDFDGNSRVICAPDNDDYLGMRLAVVQVNDGDYYAEGEANARLISAAPDLLRELDVRVGDLFMLRKAIEAGDPKAELLFRIDDMLRETRAAIAKAGGQS